MILRLIYEEALAQASYLVGCPASGQALIIDPNRDIEQYIELASSKGLRISAVTETHIHADFLSGARELARQTGAQLYLSGAGSPDWQYQFAQESGVRLLHDGDTFKVGSILIQALHTPGHTPEHLSFLLTDEATTREPMGLFSGDFLFVGDVGRPDLLEKVAGVSGNAAPGAGQLFSSLQRIREYPDYLQIWPGHGAGSACGRALGAIPQSTLGYEKRTSWAFETQSEQQFMQTVLAGQPEPPVYFARMKYLNRAGSFDTSQASAPLTDATYEQLLADLQAGVLIADTRPPEEYAAGHIPGTITLPQGSSFLTWAGWLLPAERPFSLIAEPASIPRIIRQLRLIGLENIAHIWNAGVITTWQQQRPLVSSSQISVAEARSLLEGGAATLVDVRSREEYTAGHIAGSRHIHLGHLGQNAHQLPTDKAIIVHCQGGTRSPIGASLLEARHYPQVLDMAEGFNGWQQAGFPVVEGA
jgi:hydroxyacylglutathione hydrolase